MQDVDTGIVTLMLVSIYYGNLKAWFATFNWEPVTFIVLSHMNCQQVSLTSEDSYESFLMYYQVYHCCYVFHESLCDL